LVADDVRCSMMMLEEDVREGCWWRMLEEDVGWRMLEEDVE